MFKVMNEFRKPDIKKEVNKEITNKEITNKEVGAKTNKTEVNGPTFFV